MASYGLLLLPPPPCLATLPSIEVAFKPPLEAAFTKITQYHSRDDSREPVLDLALPCSHLCSRIATRSTRKNIFRDVQRLLTSMYSLASTILENLNLRIDCRFILLDYKRDDDYQIADQWDSSSGIPKTHSVVKLPVLAASRRLWTHVFAVEGEQGEHLFQQFLMLSTRRPYTATRERWHTERVRGGLVLQIATETNTGESLDDEPVHMHYHILTDGIQKLDSISKILLSTAAFYAFYLSQDPSSQLSTARTMVVPISREDNYGSGDSTPESMTVSTPPKPLQAVVEDFLLAILRFSDTPTIPTIVPEAQSLPDNQLLLELDQNSFLKFVTSVNPEDAAFDLESSATCLVSTHPRSATAALNKRRYEKGLPEITVLEVFQNEPNGTHCR